MEKWLKTGAPKRSASRTEIRTTDLAAMEITVYWQDDNHEMQRPTEWPAQVAVKEEYQELGVKAIQYLIPFTNTELVEKAFSSYTYIKNKYQNKLHAAPDMRLYLSSVELNFIKLSSMKQAQGSH
ncbi:hypothetical protein AVEN_136722-1 [Araneus ventricosus]|uniref:HAT C-terminal dimerisation domain-containing protein n=1 Tax=Araneus ventricosus TaxID=182803 RepID=A0A4Y2ETH8_ARAVE|nr:hypothetical protein AVEN_136722-1 [Araneus ventricosus]